MYSSLEQVMAAFDDRGIRYEAKENDTVCSLTAGFRSKAGFACQVIFAAHRDETDISVRVVRLATVPEDKVEAALRLLNQISQEYRYARWMVDGDRDVMAAYDFSPGAENIGRLCADMFFNMMRIVEQVYPKLMRLIWS